MRCASSSSATSSGAGIRPRYDRILASRLGHKAALLAIEGAGGKMVGIRHERVEVCEIREALEGHKRIDEDFYTLAQTLSPFNSRRT